MATASLLVAPGMISELKCESSEKFGALAERDGKLGRSSAWIGTLLNSSPELLTSNTSADSLQRRNLRMLMHIKW